MCSSAWSRAGPRRTSWSVCCPGPGRPGGSQLPSMPECHDDQATLAEYLPKVQEASRIGRRSIAISPMCTRRSTLHEILRRLSTREDLDEEMRVSRPHRSPIWVGGETADGVSG